MVRLTRTRAGTLPGAVPPSSPPTPAREPEPEPVSPEMYDGTPPYQVWSSPPPPPRKRARSSTPQSPPPSPPPAAPQASSTLRLEYNLVEKTPVTVRLQQKARSKPAKKTPRLSNSVGQVCVYCAEVVTKQDVRMRNNLVKCSGHQVHKYCQKDCLEIYYKMN